MTTNKRIKPNQQRILVTGSSGYLGQHVLKALTQHDNCDITAAYGSLASFASDTTSQIACGSSSTLNLVDQTVLDCSSETSVKTFFSDRRFDVVIHLAAMSSPFACEKDPKQAFATNCPLPLLDAVSDKDSDGSDEGSKTLFIFLSTDQIYDGFHAPYTEKDKASPINEYGKSKLAFEGHLINCHPSVRPIILRSSLILGGVTPLGTCRKQTFFQFVQDRLSNLQDTDFYTNEYRNVVFVDDIVKVISHFVRDHRDGVSDSNTPIETEVYNMGGSDKVSRYDIAQVVAEVCGLDDKYCKAVERSPPLSASSETLDSEKIIVRSPPDISMDCAKLETVTGIAMLGLKDMVGAIFQPHES